MPSALLRADPAHLRLLLHWALLGAGLTVLALLLVGYRHRFDWELELADIPAFPLAAGLAAAGVVFLATLPLVARTEKAPAHVQRYALAAIVATGLVLRLLMLPTEPALEDDQQRYLWEGALVANGISPYRIAPADAAKAPEGSRLAALVAAAGRVHERINHGRLTTIYPAVAEAFFAAAHLLRPFSLQAWRLVLLAADLATLALLLALLDAAGLARIRSALYWLNPLVVKEVFNSGHMEGVLTPLVLAALLLAVRARPLAAAGALGLAIGVKVWPLLLLPLLLRPFLAAPRTVLAVCGIVGGLTVLWLLPILDGGLGERSGFVAYASRWQANSAHLPALRDGLMALSGASRETAGLVVRAALALATGLAALALALRPLAGPADLLARAAAATLVLVLLSPAQFPWYAVWTVAFLPFAPRLAVAAMAVTLPIYYVSFHYSAIGQFAIFRDRIVWLVWLPIWLLVAYEAFDRWRRRPAGGQSDAKGG